MPMCRRAPFASRCRPHSIGGGAIASAILAAAATTTTGFAGPSVPYRAVEVPLSTSGFPAAAVGSGTDRGWFTMGVRDGDGQILPAVLRPGGAGAALEVIELPIPADAASGFAFSMNDGGLIAGTARFVDEQGESSFMGVAWRLDDAGAVSGPFELPGLAGGDREVPAAMTEGDVIVGFVRGPDQFRVPCRWIPGATADDWTLELLDWGQPEWGYGWDVSDRGQVSIGIAAGISDQASIAAIWSPRPMNGRSAGLDLLPPVNPAAVETSANFINASGVAAGWEEDAGGVRRPLRWTADGVEVLAAGTTADFPRGIDEAGRVLLVEPASGGLVFVERDGSLTAIGADIGPIVNATLAGDDAILAFVLDPGAPTGTRVYRLEPAPATGADTDGDGDVDLDDLLAVLSGWTTP